MTGVDGGDRNGDVEVGIDANPSATLQRRLVIGCNNPAHWEQPAVEPVGQVPDPRPSPFALPKVVDPRDAEIQRLTADVERISGAWAEAIQRIQRQDNAHDYETRQLEAERDAALAEVERLLARGMCEACGMNHELMRDGGWSDVVQRMDAAEAERDAARAEIQRLKGALKSSFVLREKTTAEWQERLRTEVAELRQSLLRTVAHEAELLAEVDRYRKVLDPDNEEAVGTVASLSHDAFYDDEGSGLMGRALWESFAKRLLTSLALRGAAS